MQALIPEYRAALQQLRGQLDEARVQLEEAQADNKTLEQQVRHGKVRKNKITVASQQPVHGCVAGAGQNKSCALEQQGGSQLRLAQSQ